MPTSSMSVKPNIIPFHIVIVYLANDHLKTMVYGY